jgi:hypothetical protein
VHLETRHFEGFEEYLAHFTFVLLGVERRFSVEAAILFGLYFEAVSVTKFPDFFHFFPIFDDAVNNWLLNGTNSSFFFCFATLEYFFSSVIDDFVLFWCTLLVWFCKFRHILSWEAEF